jgi:amino acid permease
MEPRSSYVFPVVLSTRYCPVDCPCSYHGHDPHNVHLLTHLQFIVISGVIGSGIFSNNGTTLEVAGPVGLIISIICMGIIALCVGESMGELVQKFPVYNAMVEYVRVFVDPDLAFVVGIAYCRLRLI